jgi:hypothetical protein
MGVSGCGRLALVGKVSDGDLLLAPSPSSSLLSLQFISTSQSRKQVCRHAELSSWILCGCA